MKIGVNSLCFREYTIEEAARLMGKAGLDVIQLFLDFKNLQIYPFYSARAKIDSSQLTKKKFQEIFSIFESAGIEIALLGGHTNLVESDEEIRVENIENLKKLISQCRNLGTNIIATESGQLETLAQTHSSASFNRLVDSVKVLIPVLEKNNVILAIEAYSRDALKNYADVFKLIQKVNSDKIKVIIDPVNVKDESVAESLNYVGAYLVAAHVKGALIRAEKLCREFLSQLKESRFLGPIIMDIWAEHPTIEDMIETKSFLKRIANEVGL